MQPDAQVLVNGKPAGPQRGYKMAMRFSSRRQGKGEEVGTTKAAAFHHRYRQRYPLILEAKTRSGNIVLSSVTLHHNPAEQRRKNGTLTIQVNGEIAGFVTPIVDGDDIRFLWR